MDYANISISGSISRLMVSNCPPRYAKCRAVLQDELDGEPASSDHTASAGVPW